MKKIMSCFNVVALSAFIFCSNVSGQENWQLYDNFSSGTIDSTKWNVDNSSATVTIENGRAKFVHQSGHPSDSSWLKLIRATDEITGLKATITVQSCSDENDVQARIYSDIGTIGSDLVFSQHTIRPYEQRIAAGVSVSGPSPTYEFKYNYFFGNYKVPLNIIGSPFTLSTIVSAAGTRNIVDGQGEIEYSFPSTLGPLGEDGPFWGIGTRSTAGLGTCTVYFDNVYILKNFEWSFLIPILNGAQKTSQ